MRNPFRRRIDPDIRATLIQYQRAENEMVRVFVRGRKNMRAAVCFTGYPQVGRDTVTLYGTDKVARAVISLRKIAAVQRVFSFRQGRSKSERAVSGLSQQELWAHIEPVGWDPGYRYR